MFDDRLCVPKDPDLKNKILTEAHDSRYAINLGETKMYQTLKRHFWWKKMHKEIVQYVVRCLVCQKVKAGRKRPAGLVQPLSKSKHKFDIITIDFITGFPRTRLGHNVVWVIIDMLIQITHFIPFRLETSAEDMERLHGLTVQASWSIDLDHLQSRPTLHIPLLGDISGGPQDDAQFQHHITSLF
jgi:Integrase zinc binding domain